MQWYWRMDNEANQQQQPLHGTKPLPIRELALGAYKSAGNRLSYDENKWKVNPDDHLDGFILSTKNVSEEYAECMQFTEEVFCCSTSTHSRHHRTDCYLQKDGETIHSVAVKYDLMSSWQSLADDERLLVVYNRQRHAVLDLVRKKIYKIEENHELVRSGDDFRICEYLKTTHGDYALKEEHCKITAFKVEFELPKVQFCSNPLYTAVLQYGHVQGEEEDLTWHLRVKYDSSPDVYSAAKTVASKLEQLVIDCNDSELDVFVLGSHELYQFSTQLPNLRSEHFIQTRRF
uniref:Uncharacterized protein n=1 Tax=Ditylenchus dipsaci TaxID=166011 RepID=A0A915CPS4_9BILA